MHNGVYKLN